MTLDEIKKIIAEKVTGKIEPRHTSEGHRYCFLETGHIVTSVTTRLQLLHKPHLDLWKIKMAALWLIEGNRAQQLLNPEATGAMIMGMQQASNDIRDVAGNIGGVAHQMAERYTNEWMATGVRPADIKTFAPPNVDSRSIAAARSMEAWFIKSQIIPVASEILVGDKRYSAGTLDLLFLDKEGRLCLGDHKTSNGIDKISYSMQVAAYKYFFESMTGLKIYKCVILHASKDNDSFSVHKVMRLPQAYKAFKQICGVYNWISSRSEKIIKDIKRITI